MFVSRPLRVELKWGGPKGWLGVTRAQLQLAPVAADTFVSRSGGFRFTIKHFTFVGGSTDGGAWSLTIG